MIKIPYGLGSLYHNKSRDCFQAAFYITLNGEKKRRIVSAKTELEALLKIPGLTGVKIASTDDDETPIEKPRRQGHKVADIWDKVMLKRDATCKSETKVWYSNIIKPVISEFGTRDIEDITSEDIQKFINSLKCRKDGKLASNGFIKNTTQLLKAIIQYAIDADYITKNPFNDNVQRIKGVTHDTRENAFTKEEVITMLDATKNTRSPILHAVVPCLTLTGMRINEMLALRYSDLDRENGLINICNSVNKENGKRVLGTTKTSASNRTIPVPPVFFEIVDNWKRHVQSQSDLVKAIRDNHNEDVIFVGNKGLLRQDDSLRPAYVKVLESMGLKKTGTAFHGLRHTYATLVSESGTSEDIVAKLLGHENESVNGGRGSVTSAVYIKENKKQINEEKRKAIERYMAYMGDVFEAFADNSLT